MKRASMIGGLAVAVLLAGAVHAQQLTSTFSCSQTRVEDNVRALYADSGEFILDGNRIDAFRWESSLFRSTHGFDCSIDESDGLQSEVRDGSKGDSWRVSLTNARDARQRRGYDSNHGFNCAIRLEREGTTLRVTPTCPALCGSRNNFSALTVDLQTGQCRYDE